MTHLRIATFLLLVIPLAAGRQQAARPVSLAPDASFQAAIRSVLAAESEQERREAMDALRANAGEESRRLVRQLFLFGLQATSTREGMLPGVVLADLAVPDRHVIRALVPLLESDEPELRRELGNILGEYEDRSAERGASFTAYRSFLEGEAPLGLVRHMFETDPGAALLALARAKVRDPGELRELLWAEHEVADARWKLRFGFITREGLEREAPEALEQLEFLAGHARWWARLHAVVVAREEPALGARLRLHDLRKDSHPLVREVAGS